MEVPRGLTLSRYCAVIGCLLLAGPLAAQQITGQWDFNGNLQATIGANAGYWSSDRDVAFETEFGTTTSFGIADIAGQPANVMKFPDNDAKMGYVMYPEIDANGGGSYVNQYTLIMDILYPSSSSGSYRTLLQTNECNTNSGDLFLDPNNALGVSGVYQGTVTPDAWHRVAVTVDLAVPRMVKYIDGVKVGEQTTGLEVLDGRFSLYTKADRISDPTLRTLLFTSSQGEQEPGFVNSIQIRDRVMTDAQVAALGGPSAGGIPSGTGVKGQWDFENGNLNATVGLPLEYFKGCPPRECSQELPTETVFGKASELGAPIINGKDPTVMKFPALEPCGAYLIPHGAAPNGGGTKVNEYSVIMDVYYPSLNPDPNVGGWAALYQASLDNAEDAEAYINVAGGVGILGQYGGFVLDNQWHRIAIVVDLNAQTLTTYVDGVEGVQVNDAAMGIDGRFALDEALLLFAEPANFTSGGFVNSLQVRDYAMTAQEIALLGGPTSVGIGTDDSRPAPDADKNGFVNQADYDLFAACLTGPAVPLAEADLFNCENFDVDEDNDVDQDDFAEFQRFYSGSVPCGTSCFYP